MLSGKEENGIMFFVRLPKSVSRLIENFERLPGIGPKTAGRLTFYLLGVPQNLLDDFGEALKNLRLQTVVCSTCFNVAETDPCFICADPNRDHSLICAVEQPLDVLALEKSGKYRGVYHVLGGVIDPLNNIGPDEVRIKELLLRVTSYELGVNEIILATDPDMEGEATAMYITKEVGELRVDGLRVTRLGQGLPIGADLEYADEVTLGQAIEGRREY
jgi:recombination protein RecR